MTASAPQRGHTQTFLKRLLQERRLRPRSSLGQCFLIDLNLMGILLDSAQLQRQDFVLEVGSGTGSLTQRIAPQVDSVLSVEIDRRLYAFAEQTVQACRNVSLLNCDILKNKNTLNPTVLRAVAELSPPERGLNRKLVANLPYAVATPVITLLLLGDLSWERMVVTVQKELADRLFAPPGTKEYGSASVLVQALADGERIRDLPASAFWPQPKVSSAIVRITPSQSKRAQISNVRLFARFVRGVMLHRRKNLRGAIQAVLPRGQKPFIDQFLREQQIDPKCRAESLAVDQFVRLAENLPDDWRRAWQPGTADWR